MFLVKFYDNTLGCTVERYMSEQEFYRWSYSNSYYSAVRVS
jgi:hypothetical protein